jgi:hypothetical protein
MNELIKLWYQIIQSVYIVFLLWGMVFLIVDKTRLKLNPTWRKYTKNIGIVLWLLLMSVLILSLILEGINYLLK